MAWKVDKYGNQIYVTSIFSMTELPTWKEMIDFYNEYVDKSNFIFINNNPGIIDKYWKIPSMKLLLSLVCNQFNKMIFEDCYKDKVLLFINDNFKEIGIVTDIEFRLSINEHDCCMSIYSVKNPNGFVDPFITNYPRFVINNTDSDLYMIIILETSNGNIVINPLDDNIEIYKSIIKWMITPYYDYFSNSKVGNTVILGYDPAR